MRWGRLWQCWHASGETQAARFVILPALGLLQLGSFQRLTWCLLPGSYAMSPLCSAEPQVRRDLRKTSTSAAQLVQSTVPH